MGSLVFGHALSGLGKGITINAAEIRKKEAADDDREHDRQLQAMRQKFLGKSQQAGFEHEEELYGIKAKATLGAAKTRRDFETEMYGIESGATLKAADLLFDRRNKLQMDELTFKEWKTNVDNESDEFQTMMGGWIRERTGKAGTKRKAGEWTVEYVPGMNFETGQPTVNMFATHPNGTAMEQLGNRMIEAAGTEEDRDKGLNSLPDPAKKDAAEFMLMSDLKNGKDTSEQFLRQFKYLPSAYFRAKFEQDDSADMQQFLQHFQRTRSQPNYGGQQPRSTPERLGQEVAGSAPPPETPPVTGSLVHGEQLKQPFPPTNSPPATRPLRGLQGPETAEGIPIVDTSARGRRKEGRAGIRLPTGRD